MSASLLISVVINDSRWKRLFEIWIYEYTLYRWPLQTTLPHYMYVRWYLLLFFVVILDDASVEEARAQVWIYIDFTQPQRVLECYHGYSQTPRLSHDYAQDCTQLHCLNTLLDLHWIGNDILHTIKYNLCTTIYNIVYRHASRQTCTIVLTIYSNFHTS